MITSGPIVSEVEVSPVAGIIMLPAQRLASACSDAAVVTQIKLSRGKAAVAEAQTVLRTGTAAFGILADVVSHGTPAYRPVFMDRPMGDEQTNRTANGGAQGPQYAWREPVIT